MTFLNELLRFVRATETEQQRHLSRYTPTIEEYIHVRMSTSAVTPCLALNELCYGIELPRSVMKDPDMQRIWEATNVIISLMNDVLSLKKEVALGQIDTIVPLLYLEHGSLETAMEIVEDFLVDAVKDLDAAEVSMLERYGSTGDFCSSQLLDIQKMIDSCKYACTGNLNWRQVQISLFEYTQLTALQSHMRSVQDRIGYNTQWCSGTALGVVCEDGDCGYQHNHTFYPGK